VQSVAGESVFAGLRVLDLSDHKGALCGRLLADMGADVIKVEPPGGDAARRIGPFLDDQPHPDRSLFFWFYNLNKRSLTLDLASAKGAEVFGLLAQSADLVIESFAPGHLGKLGLGWNELHKINPALVLCSIAPFGQTGPYRDYMANDSVLAAMGGMLYVCGYPGQTPVRPLGLQAYHPGSYYAVIGIMGALFARARDGIGQWVDVSTQEATAAAVEHLAGRFFGENDVPRRYGTMHWMRGFRVARCRNGYVMHSISGDWNTLLEWVNSDGKAGELTEPEWSQDAYRRANYERLYAILDEWVKDKDRDAMAARAQNLRLPYAAVRELDELISDEQLLARDYFVEVEHPELGRTFRYPGAPCVFSATPARVYRRPPLVGEHTSDILGRELGMDAAELAVMFAQGVI
jgi:crotonobetainyl-CoA:carnitine CoA-transferase CaiB-like acyl-CoA transferase